MHGRRSPAAHPGRRHGRRGFDLDDAMFGIEPNVAVHAPGRHRPARRRPRRHPSTKTRAEVRRRRRQALASRRAPAGPARARSAPRSWRGGGVALGPKPRSYRQRTPKKMVRLALRSALSDRAGRGQGRRGRRLGLRRARDQGRRRRPRRPRPRRPGSVLVVIDRATDRNAAQRSATSPRCTSRGPRAQRLRRARSDWLVFTRATLPGTGATVTDPATTGSGRRPS